MGFSQNAIAQFREPITTFMASDPGVMRSQINADAESYIFHGGAQFYAMRLGLSYALDNERHLLSISLPFVHTIFQGDYAGFENTSGIGDLRMTYMFVPYVVKNGLGLQRVSTYFEATAPTGEFLLGRGAGTWLYRPGVIFTLRTASDISFYPEVSFQFSGAPANSRGGSNGIPDPQNPDKDGNLQNFSLWFPMVIPMETWDGWFSINPIYMRSFEEKTDFIFLRMDIGKMIGDKTAASLRITKFVAGQPRLNVMVQANFKFFL